MIRDVFPTPPCLYPLNVKKYLLALKPLLGQSLEQVFHEVPEQTCWAPSLRSVTLSARHNCLPCLPTELTWCDALTKINRSVIAANSPDLERKRLGEGSGLECSRYQTQKRCSGAELSTENCWTQHFPFVFFLNADTVDAEQNSVPKRVCTSLCHTRQVLAVTFRCRIAEFSHFPSQQFKARAPLSSQPCWHCWEPSPRVNSSCTRRNTLLRGNIAL